jgi:hypothetical protein
LVLVHKAIMEYRRSRQNGSELPVLFLCFNLTLVNYLKRLLAGHQAPLGRRGIEVRHFYEFCQFLLEEPLAYENEDSDYYDVATRLALESVSDQARYAAVFIDEGQDFSDDMIAVAKADCAQDGLFWLACDQAQGLYGHRQENFTGRRFQLLRPYRATRSLTAFCQILAGRGRQGSVVDLPSDSGTGHPSDGEPPLFCQAQNPGASIAYLAERIGRLHDSGLPYSEIMVLYAVGKHQCLEGRRFPLMIKDHLEDKGDSLFLAGQGRPKQTGLGHHHRYRADFHHLQHERPGCRGGLHFGAGPSGWPGSPTRSHTIIGLRRRFQGPQAFGNHLFRAIPDYQDHEGRLPCQPKLCSPLDKSFFARYTIHGR